MKIAIITTYAHKIFKARKELLNDILGQGLQIIVMGPEEAIFSKNAASEFGVEYNQLNILRHNTNPIKEIKALLDTSRKIELASIDCILVYGTRMIPNVVIAAKLAKVPNIVCVVNGAGNLFMLRGLKGAILRLLSFPVLGLALRLANTVIFQNNDDYADFRKYRLINKDTAVITNGSGVNIEEYPLLPLPDEMEFLLVTRVTGSKGVNEFLEAAKIITHRHPSVRFSLVGQKDDNDGSVDWEKLCSYHKQGIIKYHGESDDVIGHLRECRVYVFPSYYREGVPRSVLEALSVGRPIITTDTPGCRETVINGVNGFLIAPKDVNQLVDKMIWMIEHSAELAEMGKCSREICEKKFDVNLVNAKVIKWLLE